MVSLGRKAEERAIAPISSRLLPGILDPKKLDALTTINILDFGRANSRSLEFFNQFACRLSVLDAAETLLNWSQSVEDRMEDPPSHAQMQLELTNALSAIGEHRYDLVFLWDTLNHIHPHALTAFAGMLRRHVTANFRGHGFMMHKRGTDQLLRHMGLADADLVAIHDQSPANLYPHNRKVVNESLGGELQIDHGVLHGDGRLEFILGSATSGSDRRRV